MQLSVKLRTSASNTSTLVLVDEIAPIKAPKDAPIAGATLCCSVLWIIAAFPVELSSAKSLVGRLVLEEAARCQGASVP